MKSKLLAAAILLTATSAFARGGAGITNASEFLHESIEHSIRKIALSNPAVSTNLSGVSAAAIDADSVAVELTLSSGEAFTLNCELVDEWSRGGTVLKKEVVCFN
jgi:hypothetical protein